MAFTNQFGKTGYFQFGITAFTIHIVNVNQTLTFTQTADEVKWAIRTIAQNLIFSQVSSQNRYINQNIVQQLNLTQLVTSGNIYLRNINQTLIFNPYLIKHTQLGIDIVIPSATATVVNGNRCVCILDNGSSSIVLPCPQLGDTQANTDQVVLKRSMNNLVYAYVRANELQKLKYTFFLGRGKALELLTFLQNSTDSFITMLNWKGELWKAKLINNPWDFVAKMRYENERERNDIVLEFEGIKLAG